MPCTYSAGLKGRAQHPNVTSRHIVTVSCWNIHVWHFAQQNLLMDQMMNSPWWDKITAELPESSGKKYYYVPLEAFRSSKMSAQGHVFPFLTVPQDGRPWLRMVHECPAACDHLHLFVAPFLLDLEMHLLFSLTASVLPTLLSTIN